MLVTLVDFYLLVFIRQPIVQPKRSKMRRGTVRRAVHQPDRCLLSGPFALRGATDFDSRMSISSARFCSSTMPSSSESPVLTLKSP